MEQLTVQLQNAAYPVYIGSGLLAQAGTLLRSVSNVARWAVAADENAAKLYGDTVLDSLHAAGLDAALYPVPAGESAKALPVYEELCRRTMTAAAEFLAKPLPPRYNGRTTSIGGTFHGTAHRPTAKRRLSRVYR